MSKEIGFFRAVASLTFWNLAVHSLGTLTATLFSIATITWLGSLWEPLREHKWLAIAILTVLILLTATKIYISRSRFIPIFPKLHFDFLVLDKEISIRFNSLEDICYRKKITLKALRNGLSKFTDKYKWSGTTPLGIKSENDEHRVAVTHRSAVWQWYELHFDRTLKKGQTIDIEVVWSLEDKERTAIPFISTTIEDPTIALTMRVYANTFFGVRQATCEHKATMGSLHLLDDSMTLPMESGEVVWEIRRPKLFHYYEMRWNPHYKDEAGK